MTFMDEWNETAHPFHWTTKSVAKVMAKCQSEGSRPLATAAYYSGTYHTHRRAGCPKAVSCNAERVVLANGEFNHRELREHGEGENGENSR